MFDVLISPSFISFFFIGVVIAIVILLFVPKWGLIPFLKRAYRLTDKILIEDALKYIHLCNSKGHKATLHSISGALFIPSELTLQLIEKMLKQNLIIMRDQTVQLSTDGHQYAIQIIRAHRLSEEYLAQKTGYPYEELHHRARKMDHSLSSTQVNDISSQLGNPLFDFHGDPIPSANGNVKQFDEISLSTIPVNQKVRITHLEDEPKEVYAQLLAEGLYPGLCVQIKEKNNKKIRFTSKEGEHILAPIVAINISVIPLEIDAGIDKKDMILSDLLIGHRAKILELSKRLRKNERRRLMDLGFIPETIVEASLRSAHGDLTAYEIRGSLIALRREQTDKIKIVPLTPKTV